METLLVFVILYLSLSEMLNLLTSNSIVHIISLFYFLLTSVVNSFLPIISNLCLLFFSPWLCLEIYQWYWLLSEKKLLVSLIFLLHLFSLWFFIIHFIFLLILGLVFIFVEVIDLRPFFFSHLHFPLSMALVESHNFDMYVCFLFHLLQDSFQYSFWFLIWSSGCLEVYYLISEYLGIFRCLYTYVSFIDL
jgi:hypothetical protein